MRKFSLNACILTLIEGVNNHLLKAAGLDNSQKNGNKSHDSGTSDLLE
jgi:hypothetical protein